MIKILKYNEVDKKGIFARTAPTVDVEDIVADIIYDVRKNGDKALFKYCEKFDKAKLSDLAVSRMMGMLEISRIFAVAVIPSISGIITSSSTR